MSREAATYFEDFAKYSRRGINEFLRKKVDRAGFLLMMVMSGIDTLGGLCYDFRPGNSGKRSTKFMIQNMGISESVAEYLYSVVRCGLFHEGAPKLGLEYFVLYDRLDAGKVFYRDSKSDYICMNVVEFAYSYLETIEKISAEPSEYVRDYPKLSDSEKELFDEAKKCIEGDIKHLRSKTRQKGIKLRTITPETAKDRWIEEALDDTGDITTSTRTISRRFHKHECEE